MSHLASCKHSEYKRVFKCDSSKNSLLGLCVPGVPAEGRPLRTLPDHQQHHLQPRLRSVDSNWIRCGLREAGEALQVLVLPRPDLEESQSSGEGGRKDPIQSTPLAGFWFQDVIYRETVRLCFHHSSDSLCFGCSQGFDLLICVCLNCCSEL